MPHTVLCLRPEADFKRVGVIPPSSMQIRYMTPADPDLAAAIKAADAIVMPAIGPKLAPALFEASQLRLVQVTGAGIDRLDLGAMQRLGIPVANVPGGSNASRSHGYSSICSRWAVSSRGSPSPMDSHSGFGAVNV